MRTEDLIRALATDGARPAVPINRLLSGALVAGVALSVVLFLATLHARPDVAAGAFTPAFCFKLIVTLALAGTAGVLLSGVARPVSRGRWYAALLLAPVLLVGGVLYELFT